ncbi:MAG TPA: glycosyltransferase family 1 protein [Thermoanaerobaculia bacterium]|nr:glycosyltransferase family 1 protein [Thermoanaerobaculia bacterium]HUM30888.1 glycosyltransferase family 1 protein [Thermoanaerobaculia bacterium]HXK69199.1 glycosyltransferase family 1 protein [Thermoanaerobaculia bacterium]
MKIAVDGRALYPPRTGIGQHLALLLTELGHLCDLHIFLPREIAPFPIPIRATWHTGPVLKGNIYYHGFLPRILDQEKVDLFLAPLNVLPWNIRIPSVLIVHDITPLEHPGWHRMKNRLTTVPFYDRSFDRADRIIAVSRATRDSVRHYFPGVGPRVGVVPPGRPVPLPSPSDISPLPSEFLLTVSTLEPRKNLHSLLEAHSSDPTLPPLVIAGDKGWKTRYSGSDRTLFLGYVDERTKWELYRRARLFIFPSLQEGFGLPVIEALTAGTPIVSTPVPAAQEYPHPQCHIVDTSPSAILTGIQYMMNVRPGKEVPVSLPSWKEVAETYIDIFQEVLQP